MALVVAMCESEQEENTNTIRIYHMYILQIKIEICYINIYIPLFFCNHPQMLLNDIPQIYGTAWYSAPLVGELLSVCAITASYRVIYSIEHNYWWRMWRNYRTYTPGMSETVAKRGLNVDLWCQGHTKMLLVDMNSFKKEISVIMFFSTDFASKTSSGNELDIYYSMGCSYPSMP